MKKAKRNKVKRRNDFIDGIFLFSVPLENLTCTFLNSLRLLFFSFWNEAKSMWEKKSKYMIFDILLYSFLFVFSLLVVSVGFPLVRK